MAKFVRKHFLSMHISRRSFLRKGIAGSLACTILPSLRNGVAASDKVRVAHIGIGGMGNSHVEWCANLPEIEIVALCDVDKTHLAGTLKNLKKLDPDTKAKTYTDFRQILDRNDIDAITCATPDHWHAQIASMAFQSGKDVYGEKPLSYDVREGQLMLKHHDANKRVFQMGTQIHAGENYHRVVDIISSGVLGKIHTVRLWKNSYSPVQKATKNPVLPSSLDWDMWQGPAPEVAYEPSRCHKSYRYFLDYSGGIFADFWCHIADIVWWTLNPTGLKTIVANGKTPKGIADAPKWLNADFEFEDLKIHWTTKPPKVPGAKERGIGAYFEGDNGTLICDYGTKSITLNGDAVEEIPEIDKATPRSPGHQQNFIDAVKSRNQPESHLAYARKMTLPMHLALISWHLGEKLAWNEKSEQFVNNEKANAFLSRKPRSKWDLIG